MQTKSRPIELLSPAKDLNCGIEAINHGAVPSISVRPSSVRVLLPATLWMIYVSFASMRICMAPASMLRLTRY